MSCGSPSSPWLPWLNRSPRSSLTSLVALADWTSRVVEAIATHTINTHASLIALFIEDSLIVCCVLEPVAQGCSNGVPVSAVRHRETARRFAETLTAGRVDHRPACYADLPSLGRRGDAQ